MEKIIIYTISGVLYFLYTAWKKSQQQKPAPKQHPPTQAPQNNTPTPIKPTFSSTLDEIQQEIKQKQAAAANANKPLNKPMMQKTTQGKDLFVHQKKKATFGQGAEDAPVYVHDVPAAEKVVRGDIQLKNEGIYRVETMEEARELADKTEESSYELDAKQAFIGSVIFERKFWTNALAQWLHNYMVCR